MELVVLRDVLIILAATALVLTSLFASLIAWQLYRLAREVHDEVKPILASVQATADTVRGTADYVGERFVVPAAGAVGVAAQVTGAYQLVQQFYRGMGRGSRRKGG